MQKKIQLTIPKPCHEKWNSFTSTAQGGFCTSCQKEVIDFTNWSEEQLKAYFQKPSANSCGRFKEEQLKVYPYEPNRSMVSRWLSVGLTSLVLIASREASAQTPKPKADVEQVQPDSKIGKVAHVQPNTALVVSGIITDQDGSTMPGVNLNRKGTSEGMVSDADGKFVFTLKNPKASEIIVFNFIGMETSEYVVMTDQPHEDISIIMKYDAALASEVIVVGGVCVRYPWYSPRRWWRGIRSWF
ncbi:MAG TPA: carboxypeptidase-like regulatory domain-containing protein [Chryseolinea sp.]|nr:carboxypeptidase-like regulatory domain-containing protein [Chryseolinea sp.]